MIRIHALWLSKKSFSIPDSKFLTLNISYFYQGIMTNNTNNKTDRSETLAQLYEVFLYKKKDNSYSEKTQY